MSSWPTLMDVDSDGSPLLKTANDAAFLVSSMFFRIEESHDVYCTWPDPEEHDISISSFHFTLSDAEEDCHENADGLTTVMITSQSIRRMAAIENWQWELDGVFSPMGEPLDVFVRLGDGEVDEAVDLETVVGWLLQKGFIVHEPSPGMLLRGDPKMRLLEARIPYHPRLRWEMLRTRWLPHWKLTNFWWRMAGEGQHHANGFGAERSREEWEAMAVV